MGSPYPRFCLCVFWGPLEEKLQQLNDALAGNQRGKQDIMGFRK